MVSLSNLGIIGQFELTPHCNLNCKLCYMHESSEVGRNTLPASFWIEQAKQAVKNDMLVLSLTGGETLLYPELDQLMDALCNLGILISFNTNGILVDKNRVEWFLKYFPNKVNISLYGATDQTYEKYCGLKDGFTRVADAIDMLLEAGINVYLNGLITPDNIHELSAMHKFAQERNLILHASSYAFPMRTKPGLNIRGEHRFRAEDAAVASVIDSKILYGSQNFKNMGAVGLFEIDQCRQGITHSVCEDCNGGYRNFHIFYDGKMRTCALYTKISISLDEYSFSQAWELLQEKMKAIPFPAKCNACDRKCICPVCKAAVYLETGDVTEAPEYLCRYSQIYEDILRKECAGVRISLQHSGNLSSHHCEF